MKTCVLAFVLLLSSVFSFAQEQDPVVMNINGKDVRKSEFDYIYNKSNTDNAIDKKTLEEYIELFKNFKLRVAEAESQGLDTVTSFRNELKEYRDQLAKPYLSNLAVDETLVRTQYGRMKDYCQLSHIMVLFPREEGSGSLQMIPADTLEIYQKINQVHSLLMKGQDFGKLAMEYSEDAQSIEGPDPGYIGWFSGLMLNPTLEEAVFSIEPGKFSRPIRTSYGYHIMKVLDKRPNPGQIKASHILVKFPDDADQAQKKEALAKINEVYQKVQGGQDFAELARTHSSDGSASQGGDLGWFGLGAMVKEFEDAAFGLNAIGDVSKPFESPFGYHIVKLMDRKAFESFEAKRTEIETKYSTGGFFNLLHKPAIDELKTKNNFRKNDRSYESLMNSAREIFPADALYLDKYAGANEILFSISDKNITISDFIADIRKNTRSAYSLSTEFLNDKLESFEYDQLLRFENEHLENRYPEFKQLMQEYRDGILMFEISNKEVWNRASEDVKGLEAFFNKNKKKYKWDEPYYKGYVVLVRDADTKKQIQKEISKMKQKEAVEYMLENYKVGSVSYVKLERGLFKKGENAFVDEAIFKTGKASLPEDYNDFFLMGKSLKSPESYEDVKGLVITDYQDYLEEEWVKNLNEKYPVSIYKDVIFTKK